jgi:hypothetical protein
METHHHWLQSRARQSPDGDWLLAEVLAERANPDISGSTTGETHDW